MICIDPCGASLIVDSCEGGIGVHIIRSSDMWRRMRMTIMRGGWDGAQQVVDTGG